ncbi:MAG: DUF2177 family protein [Candidatus Saccharimonadales bacterium]|nr:DUF2177 family protein [Candidatus Saccharimonadales bacterium]
MKDFIKKYLVTLGSFLFIDVIWIAATTEPLYRDQLGDVMAKDPILWPAAVFYILFVYGVLYFAIQPALDNKSLKLAAINGALFGFLAYTTYAMTNLAVIEGWSAVTAFVDMAWGATLGGSVAALSYKLLSRSSN